jgi:hypothetical protein
MTAGAAIIRTAAKNNSHFFIHATVIQVTLTVASETVQEFFASRNLYPQSPR